MEENQEFNTIKCLRCSGTMEDAGTKKIQFGEAGFFTGRWSNLLSGALKVKIHICSKCGKVEFYSTDRY